MSRKTQIPILGQNLIQEIKKIHEDRNMRSYGSPRMHKELLARGYQVSLNTVASLMSKHGIAARTRRKFKATTNSDHQRPVAENVLKRQFVKGSPNRVWVSDITYVWTDEGWLYLAIVLDTYSRKIVGWSIASDMQTSLVINALRMALGRRPERPAKLVHHSDRGSQYASSAFQKLLEAHGIQCSMSRKGDCWDNAMAESFFATIKKERIEHVHYRTREQARADVFDYVEMFYNPKRRHSALGYVSPDDYERAELSFDSSNKGNGPELPSSTPGRRSPRTGERPTAGSDEGNSSRQAV
jgi:transposase InsO family protein